MYELAIFVKKQKQKKKKKQTNSNWFELKGVVLGTFPSNSVCPLMCIVCATSSCDQLRIKPSKVKSSEYLDYYVPEIKMC